MDKNEKRDPKEFSMTVDDENDPQFLTVVIPIGSAAQMSGVMGRAMLRGLVDEAKGFAVSLWQRKYTERQKDALKLIVPKDSKPLPPHVVGGKLN